MATTNGTTTLPDARTSEAGRWTTLQEAAEALGLSRDAVRRRVAARVLRAERRRTVRGPRLFVWLPVGGVPDLAEPPEPLDPGDRDAPRGGTHAAHSGEDSARGDADATRGGAERRTDAPRGADLATTRAEEMARYTAVLLEPWRRQVEEQAERIGRLEERAEHLQAELEQTRGQLAEAIAPKDPPETESALQAAWPERRSWWQRLLWG
jgi:hypothetical protein